MALYTTSIRAEMIRYGDIIQEYPHGVKNHDIFNQYIEAVTDYLGGNIGKKEGERIIKFYDDKMGSISKWLYNRLWNSNVPVRNDGVLCFRALSFNSVAEMRKEIGGNLKKNERYKMASYSGRAVFSWSTDKHFVDKEWGSAHYIIMRAIIPFDQILFATDLYSNWEDGAVEHDDRFIGIIHRIRYQHEVIVWHKNPIDAYVEKVGEFDND